MGWKEKRNCACSSIPIAQCNWQCYLNRYKDLQRAFGPHNIAAAKKHYLTDGWKEKRNCTCSGCNWQCYLNRYKDVQRCFGPHNIAAAKKHYLTDGWKEKRN